MSTVSEAIQDFEGATPRVIADLESLDFEIRYMRDDVEDLYTDVELDEAYKLLMGQLVGSDDFKSLIGEQECRLQTLFYENVVVFIFPSDRYEAVLATFDYDGDFPVNQLLQQVSEVTELK
ncbi:hypothetical protein [Halobaculum magnesiiphilum]|uniref:Uncharacterized protein n=1 Tax=Halobaculum magnesiiphilum TaxID=1017351 RepID=A0A8T8WD45_9EURY|nr:hypothetical protein [Halobaculum magnesiiphilum]QZP37755.1 hypothetical protein K6T50_00815 [Halobaculum magnesiiphilum]